MEDFWPRLIISGVVILMGLLIVVFYGRDGGESRLEALKYADTPKGALPLPVITPEFEQRYYRRVANEKRGILVGFIVMIVPIVLMGIDAGLFAYILLLLVVCTCRAIANMIDRVHEIRSAPDESVRYSRGRFVSLTDYVPWWAIVSLVTIGVVCLIGSFVATASYSLTAWRPYIFIPLCVTVFIGFWCLSARIARQPVFASSEADLRWEDSLIAEDAATLPLFGMFLPVGIVLSQFPQKPPVGPVICIFAAMVGAGIIAAISHRTAQRRLWPDFSYKPRRGTAAAGGSSAVNVG